LSCDNLFGSPRWDALLSDLCKSQISLPQNESTVVPFL
jgi:hypothetical protein